MANVRYDSTLLAEAVRIWREHDCNITRAAVVVGMARPTFQARINEARALGIEWENDALAKIHVANCLQAAAERLRREWGAR